MKEQPPLPQSIWDQLPPEAQAAVSVLVQSFERRIADLEERLVGVHGPMLGFMAGAGSP